MCEKLEELKRAKHELGQYADDSAFDGAPDIVRRQHIIKLKSYVDKLEKDLLNEDIAPTEQQV